MNTGFAITRIADTAATLSRRTIASLRHGDFDMVRSAIVLACGMALIMAGAPLPF